VPTPTLTIKKTENQLGISVRNFSAGLNLAVSPEYLSDNEVQDCQNVLFDEVVGAVVKRKGTEVISTLSEDLPIVSSYLYRKVDGSEYHIIQLNNGKIYYSIDLSTWTLLDSLSVVYPADFIMFEDMLWITNKQDNVRIWDGSTTNKGLGSVLWVFDTPADAVRTWSAKGYTIFPPGEVSTNNVPRVPKGKYFEIHQGRLFIANTSDLHDEVRFSRFYNDAGTSIKQYNSAAWISINQFSVSPGDGVVGITGIKSFLGNLVIFKEFAIYMLLGRAPDYSLVKVPTTVGCLYKWTLTIFKNVLLFLSYDGIYSFNGNIVQKLSFKIQKIIDALQQAIVRLLEWSQTTTSEFELGTITNLATRGDASNSLRLPTVKIDSTTENFSFAELRTDLDISNDKIRLAIIETSSPRTTDISTSSSGVGGVVEDTIFGTNSNVIDDNFGTFFGRKTVRNLPADVWVEVIISGNVNIARRLVKQLKFKYYTSATKEHSAIIRAYDGAIKVWETTRSETEGNFTFTLNMHLTRIEVYIRAYSFTTYVPPGTATAGVEVHLYEIQPIVDAYHATKTFISREHDTCCKENNYQWAVFFMTHHIPTGTSITYEIGTYDVSGTSWANIPAGQKQSITSGSTPSIPRKRYFKWRAVLTADTDRLLTPTIDDFSQYFWYDGTWISQKRFLGNVTMWRYFFAEYVTNGKTIKFWLRVADTESLLDSASWQSVVNGENLHLKGLPVGNKWIQFKVEMSTDTGTITPIMQSIGVQYYVGGTPVGAMSFWKVDSQVEWNLGTFSGTVASATGELTLSTGASSGSYESKNHDVGPINGWGAIDWTEDKPAGTSVIYKLKWATTEGGLATAPWQTVSKGQSLAGVIPVTHRWLKFRLELSTTTVGITPKIDQVSISYYPSVIVQEAVAITSRDRYYLFCAEEGKTYNNLTIVLDNNGAWTLFRGINVSSVYLRGALDIYGGDSESGKLLWLFTGTNDKGSPIDAFFVAKTMTFNFADNLKRIRNLWLNVDRVGDYQLDTFFSFDDKPDTTITTYVTKDGVLNRRLSLPAGFQGKLFRFGFRNNKLNEQMQVKGLEIYYTVLPLRNM